ncbi:MAG: restriction endonuclease subunit S [Prolixibacteraceae bacterium]|nr:restriction endonuclease subunit S [Prolixibacteraceae bacterium]
MTKQNNIPTLRFPEFTGEWELKQLGEEISFLSGYAFNSSYMLNEPSKYQLIKMSNVYKNELRLDRNPTFWSTLHDKHMDFLLNSGDTVLTLTGTVGKEDYGYSVMINESDKYLLNQRLVRLREKRNKTTNSFISYLISHERFLFHFFANSKGGTGNQSNVSTEDLKSMQLLLPTLPEQTKIATFLTAVDERLNQLKQKKTLLEQYKKGVMQKIFDQEIRFKDDDGNEFPEWEEKELGDVSDVIMGQSPDSRSYNTEGIGELLIQGNADLSDRKSNPRNWTSEPTKKCKIGDVILTVRAPVGSVAKSVHNACIGRGVCSIRNNKKSNIGFLYQFLLSYEPKWVRLEQGSTFTAVSGSDIRTILIELPCITEQTKIVNFLTAIDEKINGCNNLISKTEAYKKGLLQQMFV